MAENRNYNTSISFIQIYPKGIYIKVKKKVTKEPIYYQSKKIKVIQLKLKIV